MKYLQKSYEIYPVKAIKYL